MRSTRPWNMKSGARSCYICWPTFPKWSRTCGKFSTNLFLSSHSSASNPLVPHCYREFHQQFWRQRREPTPHESETLLRQGTENVMPDFISWFKQKVLSNLVWHYKLLVRANNIMNYPARTCRAKPMRLWVPSWDRLPMAVPIGSGHFPVMTSTDIAFTKQARSRVGQIEEPQIPEFLCKALMGSSIMEELKKYTNSCFMVANLLILPFSNAIGLIRK